MQKVNTGRPLYPQSVSTVSVIHGLPRPQKKFGKIREQTVHKFQNAHQARTGHNMGKSSSLNAPSTWLIFLCPRTHASPQTCHHSASSVLTVQISCHIIAVFGFRKPLFIVILVPKHKSSDASNAYKPKRICDVLSISEKVKILNMIHIEKKIICRDWQVVRQERIFHSWSDEEQRKNSC